MDAYELGHVRDVQEGSITSAADAVQVLAAAVPLNRIRTILDLTYFPSANETRVVAPYIYSRANVQHVVDYPASRAYTGVVMIGLIPMGIELKLYPGERIGVWRDVATAGSTMTINYRFIDSDLPIYSYTEPQLVNRMKRARTEIMSSVSSGGLSGGPGGPAPRGSGPTRPPGV